MRKMRGLFLSNEELGKKNDDHNKSPKTLSSAFAAPAWQPTRVPPRRLLKRAGLALAAAALVYLFFANIPILGPDSRMRRPVYSLSELHPDIFSPPPGHQDEPAHAPDRPPAVPPAHPPVRTLDQPTSQIPVTTRSFNGPVKFPRLAASLQGISSTQGAQPVNRNVLFAASNLQSASSLLPVACQMASELRNYVHFVLFGSSTITWDKLREINGFDSTCPILMHDARPDYPEISTHERLENTVFRAFHHVHAYIHPQAILVDQSHSEDNFFSAGLEHHLAKEKTTTIDLSPYNAEAIPWITKLDSASLRVWNNIRIDILIQVPSRSSGGLLRLLRSLTAADYAASPIPHLIIEIPHDIDPSAKRVLETFRWPPFPIPNPTSNAYLTMRQRISPRKLTEDEASARLLESFWPSSAQHSHVLILSPQVELSPQFFHYLKYSLLQYRYSNAATLAHWDRRLFGISLTQPLLSLDGKKPFSPPLWTNPDSAIGVGTSFPFLWQAPASDAMLFFGDKWIELHDFVSRTIRAKEKIVEAPPILSNKAYSKKDPSWLEHALRLAMARNYHFLYPGADMAANLAIVHGELYRLPEEHSNEINTKLSTAKDGDGEESEGDRIRRRIQLAPETQLTTIPLLQCLPDRGEPPPLEALSSVSWDGTLVNVEVLSSGTTAFVSRFREQVGGCGAAESSVKDSGEVVAMTAQDLFCNI
ncbi:hypothetical protein F5Y16DRAFT_192436 [Xylariaceae sp. FL0255]|nr:hypothetical protein F5Y16DRAFT_192436 [Xylariaceae sp. FL0255]